MFTLREKIIAGIGVAALIALGIAFHSWLAAHDDSVRLSATIEAQKTVIAKAQEQMDALRDADKQRDTATAQALDSMRQVASKIQSPDQIARYVSRQIAPTQPDIIRIPDPTPQNESGDAMISRENLPAFRDYVEKCNECSVKLDAAKQDISSRDAQLKLAGEQLAATQKERDVAIKAAHGGGFWSRTKLAVKWVVIGAAVGLAASRAAH